VRVYYDRRAPEYDEWYLGIGRFAGRERPGWDEELAALRHTLETLAPARTLDVACGTGFLTRHLPGEVTGLDQSGAMLGEARRQAPNAKYIRGDALELPFEDGSFERVFAGHFYGHLEEQDRKTFLGEARRLAPELVIVDASIAGGGAADEWQERILNDGSAWKVYKRYFTPEGLAEELGAGRTLFAGRWFVAAQA
jgi:ubiquinone/menaquinone biosynthesis C-methylase UbiE